MKQSELEALVIAQGERLEQMSTALDAARRELTAVHQQMSDKQALIESLSDSNAAHDRAIKELTAKAAGVDDAWIMVKERMSELRDHQDGMNDTLFGAVERLEKMEAMVYARNASAATKSNMTDDDAKRVLVGDLKDKSHKEAAEIANLTYAQVYSCRGEFTFKHIHKDLRESGVDGNKWTNPWSKK